MTAFVSNRLVFWASFAAKLSPAQNHFIDWYKISDGVALAAIQGLNQKLTEELKQKGTEITELKQRLEALENIIRNQKSN